MAVGVSCAAGKVLLAENKKPKAPDEPVIDVHQHTNYVLRADKKLVEHQKIMGVTTTLLLPSGKAVKRTSTNEGKPTGSPPRRVATNQSWLLPSSIRGHFASG